MSEFLLCPYQPTCSGCRHLDIAYSQQKSNKVKQLKTLLHLQDDLIPIEFISAGLGGLRDRVDLTLMQAEGQQRIGFYDKTFSQLLDIETCPQMSPGLQTAFEELRRVHIPVRKGSLRLRVSPGGEWGLWMDFANLDTKQLLESGDVFAQLTKRFHVEVGQKRKTVVQIGNEWKLVESQLKNWFETYDSQGQAIPLYSAVGSFSQPGRTANRLLVTQVLAVLANISFKRVLEYGCGSGNFTLPLARLAQKVLGLEVDSLAIAGMARSLAEQGLTSRFELLAAKDLAAQAQAIKKSDLIFVDPPRSGLGPFLEQVLGLTVEQPTPYWLYVSCHPESFVEDTNRLRQAGYRFLNLAIVDQFPQTPHFEVIALLGRSSG